MLHFALRNTDLQLSSSYIFSKYSLCHSRRRAQEFQRLIANTGRENFPCGFLCTLKFHLNFVSTPQSMFNINRPPPMQYTQILKRMHVSGFTLLTYCKFSSSSSMPQA